jgi:hypothetical protein
MAKGGTTLRGRDRESWVPFLAARPTTPQEMDHGSRVEPAFGGTFTNSKRLANPCSSASGMAGFAGRDLAGQILSASGGVRSVRSGRGLRGAFPCQFAGARGCFVRPTVASDGVCGGGWGQSSHHQHGAVRRAPSPIIPVMERDLLASSSAALRKVCRRMTLR